MVIPNPLFMNIFSLPPLLLRNINKSSSLNYFPYGLQPPTPLIKVLTLSLLLQVVGIYMAVKADRHLLMYGRSMRFAMTVLTLRHSGMLIPMTEGTGKRLMLGGRLGQQFTFFFMTRHTESPRCRNRISNLQWVMGRMAG